MIFNLPARHLYRDLPWSIIGVRRIPYETDAGAGVNMLFRLVTDSAGAISLADGHVGNRQYFWWMGLAPGLLSQNFSAGLPLQSLGETRTIIAWVVDVPAGSLYCH
jgi:hypothetical protein